MSKKEKNRERQREQDEHTQGQDVVLPSHALDFLVDKKSQLFSHSS